MAELLPSEVLSKAADLIEPEGAWTRFAYARDAEGQSCYGFDGGAVCRCAVGALQAVIGDASFSATDKYARLIMANTGRLQLWNDAPERTQAEVVAALRQAAELARGEGQ